MRHYYCLYFSSQQFSNSCGSLENIEWACSGKIDNFLKLPLALLKQTNKNHFAVKVRIVTFLISYFTSGKKDYLYKQSWLYCFHFSTDGGIFFVQASVYFGTKCHIIIYTMRLLITTTWQVHWHHRWPIADTLMVLKSWAGYFFINESSVLPQNILITSLNKVNFNA